MTEEKITPEVEPSSLIPVPEHFQKKDRREPSVKEINTGLHAKMLAQEAMGQRAVREALMEVLANSDSTAAKNLRELDARIVNLRKQRK